MKADLVIANGTIYTLDQDQPRVEAVAVIDGKITWTGTDKGSKSWIGGNTTILNLEGRTMTPGFIESHAHLIGIGYQKLDLDLAGVRNYDQLIDLVRSTGDEMVGQGEWILGRGWHQSKWDQERESNQEGFPTHHQLSESVPNNPVFLIHASGHAVLLNSKAMELLGVYEMIIENPEEVIKDSSGLLAGIFLEETKDNLQKKLPPRSKEQNIAALELAIHECLTYGITSFHDAGSLGEALDLYQEFLVQGKLKIRLWVMIAGKDPDLVDKWLAKGPLIGYKDDFLTIASIKLYSDGALGSRSAWLLQPYADQPENTGIPVMDLDYIYSVCQRALESGFQVCTHAIGDRANREVLDIYERVFQENPEGAAKHRFRIEHAQHLHPEDIPRFSKLGIIASMQAVHMTSDYPWFVDRLGQDRALAGGYVWQSLLKSGATVINGTDAPVEPVNPLLSFYASVTRKKPGENGSGFNPDQSMSREQALRAYTLDAAFGAGEEKLKGSIQPGKLADFTVFSDNIMEIEADRIPETKVDFTIVGGEIVYQR